MRSLDLNLPELDFLPEILVSVNFQKYYKEQLLTYKCESNNE